MNSARVSSLMTLYEWKLFLKLWLVDLPVVPLCMHVSIISSIVT